jgi:two-component system response regulator MprA
VTQPAAHVLVADDDRAMRDVLVDMLGLEGLSATTAATAEQVLDAITRESLDLVLLDADLRCPEPTSFASAWQAAPQHAGLPLVILSARSEVPDGLCDLSPVAFVRKPFDIDELLSLVCRYSARTRQPAEAAP